MDGRQSTTGDALGLGAVQGRSRRLLIDSFKERKLSPAAVVRALRDGAYRAREESGGRGLTERPINSQKRACSAYPPRNGLNTADCIENLGDAGGRHDF
jgi:hypothetical protein